MDGVPPGRVEYRVRRNEKESAANENYPVERSIAGRTTVYRVWSREGKMLTGGQEEMHKLGVNELLGDNCNWCDGSSALALPAFNTKVDYAAYQVYRFWRTLISCV